MDESLYKKLGGAEEIKVIVDDIVDAHLENPVIKARFLPYLERPEHVEKVKKHMCDLLGMGTGGPEEYNGKEMPVAHEGMNISEKEFVAALDDILMVLENHDIEKPEQHQILGMLYDMKDEVVHQ